MTYAELFEEALNYFSAPIDDYRPALGMYIEGAPEDFFLPNAIVVWFEDGNQAIYIHREG